MSTPLSRAREILKQSFAECGYDEPVEVTAKTRSGKIVPVPMEDEPTSGKPKRLSVRAVAALQTIRAANGEPVPFKTIKIALGRSETFANEAIRELKDNGKIKRVSDGGYQEV